MIRKIMLLAVLGAAAAQLPPQDDGDDGSYNPEKYEVPYLNEVSGPAPQYRGAAQQPAQYQPQPAQYRPQQSYSKPVADWKNAAILSEQRYLSGDGKFGAAYKQDDGVEFQEESDPDGTRRGTYSYVDPSGQRRTVSYTAGKHGFQASGDHLPVAPGPVAPAPVAPAAQYRAQPQPQYEPQYQPQYRAQPQPQYQPQYEPQPQYQPAAYRPQAAARSQPSPAAASSSAGGYTITANY